MNKDELLDYLASTDAELYKDLMSYDGKTEDFYKQNKQRLRELPDFPDVEDKLKAPKTPKERVKDAFDDYDGLDPYYVEQKANKLNLNVDEVNKWLNELYNERKAAEEFEKKAQLDYERQKAVDDYQHRYFGMSEDNPLNKGLNKLADLVISNDTKKAIIDDPNNTAGIMGNAGADIVGTSLDFLPGYGGVIAGPAVRAARNYANGKDLDEVILNAGTDAGTNLVLMHGLKGIPGVKDIGPLHKIEEKMPWNDWVKLSERAGTKAKKLDDVPKLNTYAEAQEWINKQPKEYKDVYQKAYDASKHSPNASIQEANKALNEQKNLIQRQSYRATQWAKEHPVKSAIGANVPGAIIGTERTALHKETNDMLNKQDKPVNPKKIKGDYNKALDYLIEKNKRQWDAGFAPRENAGEITWEAYKKWMEEK